MKHIFHILLVSLLSVAAVYAQNQTSTTASASTSAAAEGKASPARRGPVFRANKDQIIAAQTMLKQKGLYSGDATGKLDADTRASIKTYQKNNGLRASGTLNRATLEKMGIALTDKQKEIPVSENSFATPEKADGARRPVFRATKDQVMEAQKVLKSGGMYEGEETGQLDDPTRDGLRKYQEVHGLKVTGTLNQVTLEKMGIALTEKQRSIERGQ